MWLTIILISSFIVGVSTTFFFKNDNPIEELCEEIIKKQTGVDFDFTPEEKEEDVEAD